MGAVCQKQFVDGAGLMDDHLFDGVDMVRYGLEEEVPKRTLAVDSVGMEVWILEMAAKRSLEPGTDMVEDLADGATVAYADAIACMDFVA